MSDTDTPHEYTDDEVRAIFLQHVRDIVRYWANLPDQNVLSRCDGVAFSILATLDGCSAGLPGWIVAPAPAQEDEEYNFYNGNNWYPYNGKAEAHVHADIAGGLHELFSAHKGR